jgi:hypothetical protein
MAAQDTTDALKHPHPDVPFATIGDDTISALETLADIFTRNFKNVDAKNIQPAPQKSAAIEQPAPQAHPIIMYPITRNYQTRPPMVITLPTRSAAPPRVPTRTRQLSPWNLSRDFLDIGGANWAIAFGENHWTYTPMMNSAIHPVTGK